MIAGTIKIFIIRLAVLLAVTLPLIVPLVAYASDPNPMAVGLGLFIAIPLFFLNIGVVFVKFTTKGAPSAFFLVTYLIQFLPWIFLMHLWSSSKLLPIAIGLFFLNFVFFLWLISKYVATNRA